MKTTIFILLTFISLTCYSQSAGTHVSWDARFIQIYNTTPFPSESIDSAVIKKVRSSIILLETVKDTSFWTATGFILGKYIIMGEQYTLCVSCSHNLLTDTTISRTKPRLYISYKKQILRDYIAVCAFAAYDVTFFMVKGCFGEPIPTRFVSTQSIAAFAADGRISIGSRLYPYSFGTPQSRKNVLTKELFSSNDFLSQLEQAKIIIEPGFSGGPITDYNGNLIGLTVSSSNKLTYMVPKFVLEYMLESALHDITNKITQ